MGLFDRSSERVSVRAHIVDIDVYSHYQGPAGAVTNLNDRAMAHLHAEREARLHVRITPPGGGPEIMAKTPIMKADGNEVMSISRSRGGDCWTYVLFNPRHSGKCEVDRDRLDAEFGPLPDAIKPHQRIRIPAAPAASTPTVVTSAAAFAALATPRATADDAVDKLAKLAELHAQGALTDDEFTAAKERLLGT